MQKRGLDMTHLDEVIALLASGVPLDETFHDHALNGNYSGHRECHIEPDWLLVYYTQDDILVLTLVGCSLTFFVFSARRGHLRSEGKITGVSPLIFLQTTSAPPLARKNVTFK